MERLWRQSPRPTHRGAWGRRWLLEGLGTSHLFTYDVRFRTDLGGWRRPSSLTMPPSPPTCEFVAVGKHNPSWGSEGAKKGGVLDGGGTGGVMSQMGARV